MKHIIKTSSPEKFEKWKIRKKLTKEDLLKKSKLNRDKIEIWKKFTGIKKVLSESGEPLDEKTILKDHLLAEQGFICCYCQQRIELNEKTIFEHFIARAIEPTKMFDYDNMFACCDGGQGERAEQEEPEVTPKYCGHAKDKFNIAINPLDENCETHFVYSFNPNSLEIAIEGLSTEGKDVIEKLNLNIEKLRGDRGKEIAKYILDENGDYISVEETEQLLEIIRQKKDGEFFPFCIALEQILQSLQPE